MACNPVRFPLLSDELSHLKETEHSKAFYKLCEYMLPGYHQVEFDLRVYLTWRELPVSGVAPD